MSDAEGSETPVESYPFIKISPEISGLFYLMEEVGFEEICDAEGSETPVESYPFIKISPEISGLFCLMEEVGFEEILPEHGCHARATLGEIGLERAEAKPTTQWQMETAIAQASLTRPKRTGIAA